MPPMQMSSLTPPLRYRLLFLDLDGTLVGRGDVVSPRTLAALQSATAAGCTLVICTARSYSSARSVARQWRHEHSSCGTTGTAASGYAVLSNGSLVAEWETGRVLRKTTISATLVRKAVEVAHALGASPVLRGVHAEEDGGEPLFTDGRFSLPAGFLRLNAHRLRPYDPFSPPSNHTAQTEHALNTVNTDAANEYDDPNEVSSLTGLRGRLPVMMRVFASREIVEALALAWRETLGTEITMFISFETKYGCWCVYFTSAEAEKVKGAMWVAEMLGVPREQTLAIGDDLNDLGLLRWAGMGVCMGDGHEEARACAAHVTGSLADDGAAQAIEKFVLDMGVLPS